MSSRVEIVLTVTALVALGFFLGKWIEHRLKKQTRKTRLTVAAVLTLLCLPGLWFAVYYLHLLPESVWLYRLRSMPGAHLWLAAFLPALMAWGTLVPRWLVLPASALSLCILIVPFLKPLFSPLKDGDLQNHWEGNACLQSTASTCGPASAASILRSLGDKSVTEKELADAAWSTSTGTEAWHLARALQKRGWKTSFSFDGLPGAEGLPGILGTKAGSYGHFIAILRETDGRLTFVDPLDGERSLPRAEFEKQYDLTGFFMAIRRN